MKDFPEAKEAVKKYEIEGEEGLWVVQKYTEAKVNPEAIRAYKSSRIVWFRPISKKVICEEHHMCDDYYAVGDIACKCCNGDREARNELSRELDKIQSTNTELQYDEDLTECAK